MIEQNRYTDETIHVANWLLLSGNVDLAELIADAQNEMKDDDEPFRHRLGRLLCASIRDEISEALPDSDFEDYIVGGFPDDVAGYIEASATALLLPFVGQAFRKVDFKAVTELVLKLRNGARALREDAATAAA